MFKWPSLIIENFYNNFDEVLKISKEVEYFSNDGTWPGKRSDLLHKINKPFFNLTTTKIIQALFPNEYENLTWSARMHFQKISMKGKGFIHQDGDEISCLIYISGGEGVGGTSLYKPKGIIKDRIGYLKESMNAYKENKSLETLVEKHNKQFQLTTKVAFEPNKLFLFDSNQYHAADDFVGERCTIVVFFQEIRHQGGATLNSSGRSCRKYG